MLTTSLRLLRKHEACEDRYAHLKEALGKGWPDSRRIPLDRILRENGIDDALWALCAVPKKQEKRRDLIAHTFACDCAERALEKNKRKGIGTDPRSWKAVETKRAWMRGEATDEDLSAARSAAWSAEHRWQAKRFLELLGEVAP